MREEKVTYLSLGEVGGYSGRPLVRALTKSGPIQTWVGPLGSHPLEAIGQAGAVAAHTHVVGHGAAGGLALALAQHVPVRSVAVLGLGAYSGLDWHAYARQRLAIPCGRWVTLSRLVRLFFGVEDWTPCRDLALLLDQDLKTQGPVSCGDRAWGWRLPEAPVWVGGAADDPVVLPRDYSGWSARLRPGDRREVWPQGGHFFHYHHPGAVASELQKFWQESIQSLNFRKSEHDTSYDCPFAAVADAAESCGFTLGAPGQPPAWGNGTPARGRAVADRRGGVAGHHLG